MKVRFRFAEGRRVTRRRGKNRRLASAVAALLVPVALMAFVLGVWKLAADLGMAGQFDMTGVFSHWQVWMGLGFAVSFLASALNRYGHAGALEDSRVVTPFPHGKQDRERAVPSARRRSGS